MHENGWSDGQTYTGSGARESLWTLFGQSIRHELGQISSRAGS